MSRKCATFPARKASNRQTRHAAFAHRSRTRTPIVTSDSGISMPSHLSWRDASLAVAIVFVWGTNFVVIRLGLNALPPLFFATLRFVFVFAPAALFLPRPRSAGESQSDPKYVAWSNLAIYGVCIGLLQFGMLFIAMNGHISPGLAS